MQRCKVENKQPVEVRSNNSAARVTVVVVTYNSDSVIEQMIQSLPQDSELVVVDNGSSDLSLLQTLSNEHQFTLIQNSVNLGFGSACNLGADYVATDFILFLNPDTQLGVDCIGNAVAAFDAAPECVALNPAISDSNGSEYFKRGSVLLPKKNWLPRGWPSENQTVQVLSGAALFVRTEAFAAIGGFDENIFLYHEDDDLSLRLSKVGSLMFIRDSLVIHIGGASSPRTPELAAWKAIHMGRSRVYTVRKNKVLMGVSRAVVSALLQLMSPLNLISKRKRAKSLGFLAGVLQAALGRR